LTSVFLLAHDGLLCEDVATMKICLVGGIFDRGEAVRSKHLLTPETVLLAGFRKLGVDVHAVGHAGFQPSDEYDLVHVHHFGKAAMQMATSRGRSRFVFTGHNGLIVTGYERSRLRRAAFHYVTRRADAFVALSHAEADFYRINGVGDKVRLIPNGIPADVFRLRSDAAPHTRTDGGRRLNLLYVGQLIDWKGVEFLLQAVRELRRQWNVHLRLVYHNALLEADHRRLVQELGIADCVEFVGILGPDELAEEYRSADVLVLPSFADCLPSVVTEALLCGTPVVAGAVCGVPEQVGPYGRVVPPGDAAALAAAIAEILTERVRFRALAPEMRAYAAAKYNPETMVREHLDLYEEQLAGPSLSGRGKGWLNPLVRFAVKRYWSPKKGAGATA
jgi:glycosyltransferase involved in cell wall biosynthesis